MHRELVGRGVAVLLAVAAIAACGKKDGAQDTTAVASGATAATMPGSGETTAAGGTAAAPGALSDANIVFILDQANAADSVRGALAATKGTTAAVRDFGRLMAGEHHALRQQGQQLAAKLGVTPAAPAGDQSAMQAKQELDSLEATPKGKAWDQAYIDFEVAYHEQVLQTATQALSAAQNQELKDLITKAAPVIQHHLDRAKEIQKQLGR